MTSHTKRHETCFDDFAYSLGCVARHEPHICMLDLGHPKECIDAKLWQHRYTVGATDVWLLTCLMLGV